MVFFCFWLCLVLNGIFPNVDAKLKTEAMLYMLKDMLGGVEREERGDLWWEMI